MLRWGDGACFPHSITYSVHLADSSNTLKWQWVLRWGDGSMFSEHRRRPSAPQGDIFINTETGIINHYHSHYHSWIHQHHHQKLASSIIITLTVQNNIVWPNIQVSKSYSAPPHRKRNQNTVIKREQNPGFQIVLGTTSKKNVRSTCRHNQTKAWQVFWNGCLCVNNTSIILSFKWLPCSVDRQFPYTQKLYIVLVLFQIQSYFSDILYSCISLNLYCLSFSFIFIFLKT